jgi:hypothetical protein
LIIKALLSASSRVSLEKLLKKIFSEEKYNNEVRPFGKNDVTRVETELKLLQIDLDEKYQQLV